jgi:hypothetical protein
MKTRNLWIAAAALSAACSGMGRQARDITVTGCLQPGEQGLASPPPSDAPASPANIDRFVLADANSGSAAPLYILEGKKDELRQHLSQQVEVTGKLADSSTSTTSNPKRLDVDSVKVISPTCPASR